jgi:hypothetical protein
MALQYLLLSAIVLLLVIVQLNFRYASPLLAIADRWLRWLIFAFGTAHFCQFLELIDRPYWVLVVTFFFVWFLGETLYNWLAISALSVSPLPLFPRFTVNTSGEEWPVQPRLLKVREWLRAQGLRQTQALKAEVGGGLYLRASIYQDAATTLRVQVTFLPQTNGTIGLCYTLTSVTANGERYVTDNLTVPFAGFYPENWFVERRPWSRSLPGLLARHRARMLTAKAVAVPFALEPLVDLNAVQNELDRLNTELGFLHPHPEREDFGKITHEGRYRVWKEIWLLNYLGRAQRYE